MNIYPAPFRLLNLIIVIVLCSFAAFGQRTTSLRGQVSDQVGAVIVGATVTLTDANGKKALVQTDDNGAYRFDNVANGVYTLSAQQKGFTSERIDDLQISTGVTTHNFQLSVSIEEQRVTVDDMRS